MTSRCAVLLSLMILGCEPRPATNDGGTGNDGGGATGGGGGGATGGGGGSATGGGGGVDPALLFGELCDPALSDMLVNSCRVEPVNPFTGGRCINARYADGGMLSRDETTALLNQGTVEACSMFGAALLRCVAGVFPTCDAIRADGGRPDTAVLGAIDGCNSALGFRFESVCWTGCSDANEACQLACNRTVAETCGPCTFECGRQYATCLRPCLVLPDAGYPDAG